VFTLERDISIRPSGSAVHEFLHPLVVASVLRAWRSESPNARARVKANDRSLSSEVARPEVRCLEFEVTESQVWCLESEV
jgi:hypothetical protein